MRRFLSPSRALLISSLLLAVAGSSPAGADELAVSESTQNENQSSAWAESIDLGLHVLDAGLLRPLGVLSTLAGAGFFVISPPLVWSTGQLELAREVLIDTPVENTFHRSLGAL